MVSSFVLHIQPAKVNRHSLRASYSFGLGLISLYLFLVLIVTGRLPEQSIAAMKKLESLIDDSGLLCSDRAVKVLEAQLVY